MAANRVRVPVGQRARAAIGFAGKRINGGPVRDPLCPGTLSPRAELRPGHRGRQKLPFTPTWKVTPYSPSAANFT